MKRLVILAVLLLSATGAWADRNISIPMAAETGLAYNKNYDLDISNYNLDTISFQLTYSSSAFSSKTFNDGAVSTGTVTVSTTSFTTLHGAAASDTITVTTNSGLAETSGSDTINVASNTQTALSGKTVTVNGSVLTENKDWHWDVRAASWTALSLAGAAANIPGFYATATGSTVTITCTATGPACNAYTLSSSTATALVRGAAKFTGGQKAAKLTFNGRDAYAGTDWAVADVSSNTANNIKSYFNSLAGISASTPTTTTILVSCVAKGTACNAYTLASSTPSALGVSTANLTGGQNSAVLRIAGISLTEGTDWTETDTASTTAKAISDAIMANGSLNTIIASTWTTVASSSFGVVSATSTGVGLSANYRFWSSAYSAMKPSAPAFYGGSNSAVVTASGRLNIAGHGYTTGLPVLYTKTTGTSPGKLVTGTTYYVIPVDANNIQLASSSSNAVAGTAVGLSTQTLTGGGTFAVAPLAYTGTVIIKLQTSNDGTTFTDTPYAVTYSTTVASATKKSITWNLGAPTFQVARVAVTGPTQGGLALTVTARGRQSSR